VRVTLDLSVVVPVYGNAATVAALAEQVATVAQGLGISHEIVFVNDSSPDDSLRRLQALAAASNSIVVIDLACNLGQHAAVLHGLARTRGQVCAIMDADLQDRPASLAVLWRARQPGCDVVFGGRRGRYQDAGRHATSRLFKWLLGRLTGVPDDAGIFLLMERALVERLVRFPTRTPWMQSMIGCLGARTISVPVDRDMRATGTSSYSAWGRVRTATRGIWCAVEYRLFPAPLPYLERPEQKRVARRIAASTAQ
jgi:glycosyltransferase involved in cell wall biosynthesis